MSKEKQKKEMISKLAEQLSMTHQEKDVISFIDARDLPVRDKILGILNKLIEVLFPGYTGKRAVTKTNINFIVGDLLCDVTSGLTEQVEKGYLYQCSIKECEGCDCRRMAEDATGHLLGELPRIKELLKGDVTSAFDGDPAAKSYEEVVISYPCITAIATYRIAHELYLKQVPLIPRIMSECAHSQTGIDIHPGAKIGKRFFIDHGTGVVIGETTVIGDNVKIYQGATLGALSFPKDERGRVIKGRKRHPTIEDNVTIYAEATILGDVTIGKGSIVGGNVWIKKSIPPGFTVTTANADLICTDRESKGDLYEI